VNVRLPARGLSSGTLWATRKALMRLASEVAGRMGDAFDVASPGGNSQLVARRAPGRGPASLQRFPGSSGRIW
jgi:hypothetical protein